ncbi:MAG: hypothetical protein P8Q90_04760 [Candidatus Thalassarchaeaceae archaeon]|nr:hypothetical protein [Candidatus Thalassarchaeaceae archaeon]
MVEGLAGRLQHPRRSLGDRHRSQALKFLRLSEVDVERDSENTRWAEQNARQALLHDFTHPENWRTLAQIKVKLADEIGLRALLSDLFSVLGRDPEQVNQLVGIPILDVGIELLEAALISDHLDPDLWYESLNAQMIQKFSERFAILDLSDPRCNVLFGRRVERLWVSEGDDVCIPLARLLLSNRPQNFEMWTELARAHERMGTFDEAWFCYDQAQTNAPHIDVRDQFRNRMEVRMETGERLPWKQPTIEIRDQFLGKMQDLASRFTTNIEDGHTDEYIETVVNEDEIELIRLIDNSEFSTAFFLSRRLLTRGENWAEKYFEISQKGLQTGDDVHIP